MTLPGTFDSWKLSPSPMGDSWPCECGHDRDDHWQGERCEFGDEDEGTMCECGTYDNPEHQQEDADQRYDQMRDDLMTGDREP